MRDLLICLPTLFTLFAQLPQQDSLERLGIAGLSIGVSIALWRHFIKKEADAQTAREAHDALEREERKVREAADTAERNRLLEVANALQAQVVELLQSQVTENAKVASTLVTTQKDFLRAHEDGQRSIKDLARKIPSSRHVTVDNEVLDVNVKNDDAT